jgi:hypothetical protein
MFKHSAFLGFLFGGFLTVISIGTTCGQTLQDHSMIDIKSDSSSDIMVSQLFSSAKFVPLETTVQGKLSEISEALFYKGVYVLFDGGQQTLGGFDQKGKFLFKISPKGNGPLALNSITDYTINQKNNSIDVYDATQKKIVSFDFLGRARSEKRVNFVFSEFACTANGDYVIYAPDLPNAGADQGAFIIDSNGRFKKSFLQTSPGGFYVQPINCLSGFGDSILLVSNYSTEIFIIKNDDVTKRYTVQTGENWDKNVILARGSGSLLTIVHRKKEDEPKSYTVFSNGYTGKQYHLAYLLNDLFLIPIPIPHLFKDSHTLLVLINPQEKNKLLEIIAMQEKNTPNFDKTIVAALKDLLNGMNSTDNYVLVELSTKI